MPFFKRAVEIDPGFAMAYAFLGTTYREGGQHELSAEAISTAYRLREHASDREKFFIATSYALDVTGNLERAQQSCDLWAHAYPRAWEPHGFLTGIILPVLGQYERAVEEGRRTLDLNPNFAIGYFTLASSYQMLDRLPEAEQTLRLASERNIHYPDFLLLRYDLAFLRSDEAGMQRLAAEARRAGAEAVHLSTRGSHAGLFRPSSAGQDAGAPCRRLGPADGPGRKRSAPRRPRRAVGRLSREYDRVAPQRDGRT